MELEYEVIIETNICIVGTQYSEWIPVPENKNTYVYELVEGKKFQMQTDKEIDAVSNIRWMMKGPGWFTFITGSIAAYKCSYTLQGTEGFLKRAGVLTFLKTSTQLQVWFDDVLEVTWVYEDNSDGSKCAMRNTMTGLRFHGAQTTMIDKVSTHYRYEIGNLCALMSMLLLL